MLKNPEKVDALDWDNVVSILFRIILPDDVLKHSIYRSIARMYEDIGLDNLPDCIDSSDTLWKGSILASK